MLNDWAHSYWQNDRNYGFAWIECFLCIVDKFTYELFALRYKYSKLHSMPSGHQAAFNKIEESNVHLFRHYVITVKHRDSFYLPSKWKGLFSNQVVLSLLVFVYVPVHSLLSVCVCRWVGSNLMGLTYSWHTTSADFIYHLWSNRRCSDFCVCVWDTSGK